MLAVFNFCLNISIIQAHSTSQQSQNLEIYQDIGGNFTLLSSNNQYVSLEDFQGKVVLMFFGFTACPDTCPLTLSKLKQVMARLDQKKPVQQLFITVDPKRDNPEQLKSFLSTFNLNIIGLTGTEEEILHVAELYGSAYMKNPTINSETSYLMIHTGYVYLIDPQGQVRAIYPQDTEEIRIIEDIRQLLANI
tara:strand:+ start:100 stop:675 length:576 start_codon:yes stop_codon:yes gene_type:complete